MTVDDRGPRRRLGSFARRSREVIGLAALVGGVAGVAVAGIEFAIDSSLDEVSTWPLWAAALLPAVGLAVAHLVVRATHIDRETTDAYIRTYHEGTEVLPSRPLPWKLLAAFSTLATGGALGLEGPSLHTGATLGSIATGRLHRLLTGRHAKVLMVAGAAAGVAAIFKAPATGAVFAIEVPYREDFGRRLLLPALVGAATGYLALVLINGTARVVPGRRIARVRSPRPRWRARPRRRCRMRGARLRVGCCDARRISQPRVGHGSSSSAEAPSSRGARSRATPSAAVR